MTTELHWPGIALRLLLTVVAGSVLGVERSKTGHPAGLRTTLLVTLAASVSMIQVNLLLGTNGKPADSYIVMDLMRLPLGILTGVGFIGAGAIVRKGEMVLGITTAATMWFATVVGLCLGGGQLILGSTATALGFLILWALRFAELRLEADRRGVLVIAGSGEGISAISLVHMLSAERLQVQATSAVYDDRNLQNRFRFDLRWRQADPAKIPAIIERLRSLPGVTSCEWDTSGRGLTC